MDAHPNNETTSCALQAMLDEPGTVYLLREAATLPVRLELLTLHGCRAVAERAFLAGAHARVEIAFRVKGTPLRFVAVVDRVAEKRTLELRFLSVSERRVAELEDLLRLIEAQAKAKQQQAQEEPAPENPAGQRALPPAAAQAEKAAPVAVQPETRRQALLPAPASATPKDSRQMPIPALKPDAPRSAAVSSVPSVPVPTPAVEAARTPSARPPSARTRDRRSQSRHTVDSRAVIFLIAVASRAAGRILDVSIGGCRIRTDENFPVGIYRRVEVEFTLDQLPFRLPGVTQALHDKRTVGIRFLDLSERKRDQLMMVIEELAEQQRTGTATMESAASA